jgi:3-hydroxybutyrate dehydrogenase
MLKGRTAVVTGAANGIGQAIATRLAQEGARVIVSDIREQSAQDAVEQLRSLGLVAEPFVADAGKEEDIQDLIQFAVSTFKSVDILVNNAGVQHVDYIEDFPVHKFSQIVQLMLVGPFMAMKYALPHMKENGCGRIINIASINGLVGFAGKAAYNSAKHGLIGLTKVAALETATHGITVNALCPGYVDTPLVRNQMQDLARTRGVPAEQVLQEVIFPLVPQRKLIEVSEIADYAAYLATDQARSITGQAVVIDGGYVAQ